MNFFDMVKRLISKTTQNHDRNV